MGGTEFFIFMDFPTTLIFRSLITETVKIVEKIKLIQCRNTT
jgi:hypothetical protein